MAWYFVCSEDTRNEVFNKQLFADSDRKAVEEGDTLFLQDLDADAVIGPFEAETAVQRYIDSSAFGGSFPWQVRVSWDELHQIDASELPYVEWSESVSESRTQQILERLHQRGERWSPEGEVDERPDALREEIRELDGDVHRIAHRIEEARMLNNGHPADREVNIDRWKGEFYHKMKSFVWAVRKYDQETNDFELPSNQ
jgi:hypothetical protein